MATIRKELQLGASPGDAWITDVLPNEMAAPIDAMAEHGAAAMRKKLGRQVP